jgi:anti-sigma factor RsiW
MSENAHPVPSDWLTAYYDGELDVVRQAVVATHLLTCDECRRELEALRSLSEALSADKLDSRALTDEDAFWQTLGTRLPNRRPASANITTRKVVIRWLPGLSLLVLYGAAHVVALMGTGLMLVLGSTAHLPGWTHGLDQLAASATLGWLAYTWPAEWTGLGFFAMFVGISGSLALAYLAWLAYEWRYGAAAAERASA